MKDAIVNWIVHQVVDKKRIMAALIALFNLAIPYIEGLGVEIPEELKQQSASFGAIVLLAAWSKYNARKEEKKSAE